MNRLPTFRFSLRTIILATAVTAAVLGLLTAYLHQRAQWYARDEFWRSYGFYTSYDKNHNLERVVGLRLQLERETRVRDWKLQKTIQWLVLRDCVHHAEQLAGIEELPNLVVLLVDQCELGDDGMQWIARCHRVAELTISNTDISDASIDEIASMPNLKMVSLGGSQITDEGVARLRELRSDVKVYGKPEVEVVTQDRL